MHHPGLMYCHSACITEACPQMLHHVRIARMACLEPFQHQLSNECICKVHLCNGFDFRSDGRETHLFYAAILLAKEFASVLAIESAVWKMRGRHEGEKCG